MNVNYPAVTVVIPVKPGLTPEAISALRMADYPLELIEVLVVYGNNPSYQRNQAVHASSGDIIYFLDNDSMPDIHSLSRLVWHLKREQVVIAGGPSIAPDKLRLLPYLFAKTLESYLCTGSSSSRYKKVGGVRETSEKEVILCNMVMKKDVFMRMGGLNDKLYPNEENELMEKVRYAGMKIIYDPDAYVCRMPRKTLNAFVKQIFNYGRGRGEQTVFYPKSFSFLNFVPMFFLIYCAALISGMSGFRLPLYLYGAIMCIHAVFTAINQKNIRLLLLPLSSFLLHLVYGYGTIYGILRAPFKKTFHGEVRMERVTL